jgi:hypothetical protein
MHAILRSVILAMGTLGSSWAAYQAALWSGEQAHHFAEANTIRSESVRASNQALQVAQVDVTTFAVWSLAASTKNDEAAAFLRARFRQEFRPAFEGWLASAGSSGVLPQGTPFERADYRVWYRDESKRLLAASEAASAEAGRANKASDQFMFSVVVFGTVVFLAGIDAGERAARSSRRFMAALAIALLVFACIFMLRLPQRIGS